MTAIADPLVLARRLDYAGLEKGKLVQPSSASFPCSILHYPATLTVTGNPTALHSSSHLSTISNASLHPNPNLDAFQDLVPVCTRAGAPPWWRLTESRVKSSNS